MKRPLRDLILACPLMLTACAYSVHDVYISGFEPETPLSSGRVISSHAEQFVVLGFKTETQFMDQAYSDLQEQCPKGDIIGLVTEYQTAMGFCSWHNHVFMKGLCMSSAGTAQDVGSATLPTSPAKPKPAAKTGKKS